MHESVGPIGKFLALFAIVDRKSQLEQDLSRAGEKQPQIIGRKTMAAGTVAEQVVFDHFDPVFILPAGTVSVRPF